MKIRDDYTCPLEIVHDLIKGKWKTIIVFQLQWGGKSLSQLKRDIEGITQKMLLQHLNELQSFGIINKINSQGFPLSVEYFLTERGKKIAVVANLLQEIGVDYLVEIGQTDLLDKKGIPYTPKSV